MNTDAMASQQQPTVTVIIPNYNHARYLPKRIESVMGQSFRDFEVIILDDRSPDNSREVIEHYAKLHPGIRTVFNEKNSGSTFAQWNKGAQMACGKYLWFAESDDFCESTFLQKLVPLLDRNPKVGLAYAQTYLINEEDGIINSYAKNLEFIYKTTKWESDFIINGRQACHDWLYFHNPIPNASGALMRKEAYMNAGMADPSMKLNGDWFLYAKLLSQNDLAFCSEHLNYFRVHEHTQRERARATGKTYEEIIKVNTFLRQHIPNSRENADKAMNKVASWWMGSLYFQTWDRGNFKRNIRLYRFFRRYKKSLLLHIISTFLFVAFRYFVKKTGLLKPAKDLRKKLFPGKYFDL